MRMKMRREELERKWEGNDKKENEKGRTKKKMRREE